LTSGPTVPSRASRIAKPAVIAPNATLIGEVETGANSKLQDGTVVHTAAAGLMTVVGRHRQRVACPPFVYLGWRNFVARPRPCP
jgi:serine acetyltransferase